MSVANSKYERTVEIITPDFLWDLNAHENSKNYICNCPFCEKKTGKVDTKNKLYVDKQKLTGICFKCNTAVWVMLDGDVDVDTIERVRFHRVFDKIKKKEQCDTLQFPNRDLREYISWDNDPDVVAYIVSRGIHIAQQADSLDLRCFSSWTGTFRGVLIPFYINGNVVYFQIRLTSDSFRYYNLPGNKYLYSPGGLYTRHYNEVTLCEGVFDAMALAWLGYPTPIATIGSQPTENQVNLLRALTPNLIGLAYDKVSLNIAVAKLIGNSFPFLEDIYSLDFSPYEDPDEYAKNILKKGRVLEHGT